MMITHEAKLSEPGRWEVAAAGTGEAARDALSLVLPTDRPREREPRPWRGGVVRGWLDEDLAGELETLGRRAGVAPDLVLLAAFATLLQRYTAQNELPLAVLASGPTTAQDALSPRAGSIPLLCDLSGDPTVSEALARIGVAAAAIASDAAPLLHGLPPVAFAGALLLEGSARGFELCLSVAAGQGRREIDLSYDADLFHATTVQRALAHLATLTAGIVADPAAALSAVPMLSEAERHQLAVEWSAIGSAPPAYRPVHELIVEQAQRHPEAIAVVCGEESLTYGELVHRAGLLARRLARRGIGPEVIVGLCVRPSPEMVVGLLGILQSGAAYLPLDPDYPGDRLAFMLEESDAAALVTTPELVAAVPRRPKMLFLLGPEELGAGEEAVDGTAELPPGPPLDCPAYVIYTSGSTGRPKGVVIQHRSLGNYAAAIARRYRLVPGDRVLQFASLSFDVAADEIFPTWLSGATLVLWPNRQVVSVADLLGFLDTAGIHVANLPAALWHSAVAEMAITGATVPGSLRLLVVGNELVLADRLRSWERLVGDRVTLINAYGPTETTVGAAAYETSQAPLSPWLRSVPIGRPLGPAELHVFDPYLRPVPIGVPGELYIGGFDLARSYLHHPGQTAASFLPDPCSGRPGARLYRSGDLVRYLPDGNLEFLRRIDDQAKIRGFRVEPGEIATALQSHPAILEAAVVVRERTIGAEGTEDPEALTAALARLSPAAVDDLLRSLGEAPLAAGGPEPRRNGKTYARQPGGLLLRHPDFELSFRSRREGFIAPPGKSQRSWLLQRTMDELADDLLALDRLSKRFVSGSERSLIQDRWGESCASYDGSQLVIEDQQVMQDWETPLMKEMARVVTEGHGDVLEVGFGMGISATFIQEMGVRSHTIIECNDDVAVQFEEWRRRYPGRDIRLLRGHWEEMEGRLGMYDGVFFDTYPTDEDEFVARVLDDVTFAEHFFPTAAACLRPGGIFTYYTNEIDSFSRRHQRLVLAHFRSLTLSVVAPLYPPPDCNYWWADSMVVAKAVR